MRLTTIWRAYALARGRERTYQMFFTQAVTRGNDAEARRWERKGVRINGIRQHCERRLLAALEEMDKAGEG